MKEIIIAGAFTIIGATLGFIGTLIQSKISAKSNIEMVKTQSEKEIERHRYLEKEKLYSDLIIFIPQLMLSVDFTSGKVHLSRDDTIMLNSFKSRLNIYSTQNIYNEFYDLADYLAKEENKGSRVEKMNAFTALLLEDLNAIRV